MGISFAILNFFLIQDVKETQKKIIDFADQMLHLLHSTGLKKCFQKWKMNHSIAERFK